jgi:putative protease
MIAQSQKSELLMPAGSLEKLKYAFHYGADAVYAGVPIFSLRARENDFNKQQIKEAIEYSHSLGKKIYLTMNIFAHNSKVDRFLDSFCEMAALGPDAFIMSDVGLINKAMKLRPNMPIHLSTQANVTNWTAVEYWRDLGVRRVILSRELSLKEIALMSQKVPDIELESFVHGAICIAYSGRCLISNYINHRDANQGTCTNSCRWDYSLAVDKGSLVEAEKERPNGKKEYVQLG